MSDQAPGTYGPEHATNAVSAEAELEAVARMIARGLGHNDEYGMYWDRYLAPARIIVREHRAVKP